MAGAKAESVLAPASTGFFFVIASGDRANFGRIGDLDGFDDLECPVGFDGLVFI
jgi:hypothetical protein